MEIILDFKLLLQHESLNYVFLSLLCIICFSISFSKDIINCIIYNSVISVLLTLTYLTLNSPDVALTEACLGSAFSTVIILMSSTKLNLNKKENWIIKENQSEIAISFFVSILVLSFLSTQCREIITNLNVDKFQNCYANNYYIKNTQGDIGIPSIVAAILASYRSFDTILETLVILMSGVCCYTIRKIIT